MDVGWLSDAANVATVIGVTTALFTAFVVFRDWRHKTGHRLYIPAPDLYSQNSEDPEFWVFPPKELKDGSFAVVIAGKVVNAGPSDAFSVRIFVEDEEDDEDEETDLASALDAAVEEAVKLREDSGKKSKGYVAVESAFFEAYKTRQSLIPVLPVGKAQPFVVVARLKDGNAYLAKLRGEGKIGISLSWETDGEQAHGIHARSRTALGRQLSFGPADLCAPFEKGRWYDALRQRKLHRKS